MPRQPSSMSSSGEEFDDRGTLVAPRPTSRPPPTPRPRMARGTARPDAPAFDAARTIETGPPEAVRPLVAARAGAIRATEMLEATRLGEVQTSAPRASQAAETRVEKRALEMREAAARAAEAPRKLPAFIPAETALPMMSYRGGAQAVKAPPPAAPKTPARRQAVPVPVQAAPTPPAPPAPISSPSGPHAAIPQPPAKVERTASTPRHPMPSLARRGQVIAIFGCRGGAGATTLAINLAATMAQAGRSTCVVDLDLQLGDVFVALDLEAHTSIEQLAFDVDSLDTAAVRRRMAHHRSGLHAVSQVGQPAELAGLAARAPALLQALAGHFDNVIVDGLAALDDHAAAVLAAADQIVLVVTQEVLSVRRAARVITRLRQLGQADGRLRLVVNRARPAAEIGDDAIERALGVRVAAAIRDDARVTAALDDGALLAEIPRARGVAADVAALAGLLDPAPRGPTTPRRGLLGRLFGGAA